MTEQKTSELVQQYQDALRKHDAITEQRQASFAAILQQSTLALEEKDGLTQMSFLLPDAFKEGVPASTIQAVGNHLLETLQTVEPGENYTLTMRDIQIGPTKLGTEGEIRIGHPSNNPHLEKHAYRVVGLTRPIVGTMMDERRVIIQPDIIGKHDWEEKLGYYYQALQIIKDIGI